MSASTPGTGIAKKFMTAGEFWEFVHRPENQNRLQRRVQRSPGHGGENRL